MPVQPVAFATEHWPRWHCWLKTGLIISFAFCIHVLLTVGIDFILQYHRTLLTMYDESHIKASGIMGDFI